MSKKCPRCQTDNRDQARRCINCNFGLVEDSMPIRLCPAGRHVMDPGWTTCPYCGGDQTQSPTDQNNISTNLRQREQGSGPVRQPTFQEREALPQMPPPPASQAKQGGVRRKTEFGDGELTSGQMPTERNARLHESNRRIAAVLVTYTWQQEGEVFSIWEGRNYIGCDPDCEVYVRSDPQMSSRHASIIYRGKGTQFIIDDEKSMNGTFVNELSIDTKQTLNNYAKIRTGATVWRFVILNFDEEINR